MKKRGNAGLQPNNISFSRKLYRDRYLLLLALPGLAYFVIFRYIPMAGLIVMFENYTPFGGYLHSPWVGLKHFIRFFSNNDFWMLMRNTLCISLLNLAFFFPMPIVIALLLNEAGQSRFAKMVQNVIYIPHFFSWVIVYGITYFVLSQSAGLINNVVVMLGGNSYGYMTDEKLFWGIIVLQNIWKETGWGTIIFLSSIAGINPEYYEAAVIDGASRMQKMWHITLPGIRNVIVILFILRCGSNMDTGFEQMYVMYNSGVSRVAEVFDTYVYRLGIAQGNFSFSTAVGFFKSIVGFIMVMITNRLSKLVGEEGVF